MKNLKDLFKELIKLNEDIQSIIKRSGADYCDDLSKLEINMEDSQDLFLWDELRAIVEKLSDVSIDIDYLSKPIRMEGYLYKNIHGRYMVKCSDYHREYTCGTVIEFYVEDEEDVYHENPYWCASIVGHDGDDYYIVGHRNIEMNGLKVRVRYR